MGFTLQMRWVWYHQQTTRKKEHHDSWHSQYASLFVYVSSLHIYIPFYLTIDIIYDISLSQLQTKGMEGWFH